MIREKIARLPLPHILAASAIYLVVSTSWLLARDIPFQPASGIAALSLAVLGAGTIMVLRSVNNSVSSGSEPEPQEAQEEGRKHRRIEALKRDARKTQDKMVRLGAVIGVALVLFAALMYSTLGVSPQALYVVSLPVLIIMWLIMIVFLPKTAVIGIFIILSGLRIGLEVLGPQVLIYLPNFLMLPFFYLMMMFFMFGSIMIPNLQQIKYFKPGEGDWETPAGSTRGQFLARAMVETQIDRFIRYATKKSDRKPTRGMVFTGPPGTGKTLYSKELATELELPFVLADAAAFNAPFAGFGMLIPLIVKFRTENLAAEYGGAVIFIDEGEILFGARAGMQPQAPPPGSVGLGDIYDNTGDVHIGRDELLMMPGATGGASAAIFPFLTWMSGTTAAPFTERFVRSKINTVLNALFIPVVVRSKVLRLPPGKPKESNVMFITATNRFFMFDPAMIRPGRFGIVAEFVIPDEDERADIARHYLLKWHKKGYYQDDLITDERIQELARATPNTSPAEIEQMIEEAVDIRVQHVAELRRLKGYVDRMQLNTLHEKDQKFWLRFANTVYDGKEEVDGWDDERVDWHALMETRSAISFGRANPERSNETTKRKVAFHELGHFIALNTFNGERITPTLLSVIPRRGTLGMVAHVPHDTREMHPQEYYEGLVRTSVAAWVTERYFFGQNLPGVVGDLQNATNVASLMVGKFGMKNYECNQEDRDYYAGIGSSLISEPETTAFNPQAASMLQGVLHNPSRRKDIAVIIGMAAIDAYRLIRKNNMLFLEVIPEFLELDEFSGQRLEDLWDMMTDSIVPLDKMLKDDRAAKPKDGFAATNTFYSPAEPEGAAMYAEIEEKL
jgi:SpoVK/Ycf46/Vps4 family AAA+-type ATPase